jgi:hypothetical protein
VVVGHRGFKGPNIDEFLEEHYQEITRLKGKVLKATILTHSLETSLADQFKGSAPTLLIANTLRRLGQGLKVCCEIVMEAVDAGLIPEGEEVVAVGGTARGWDTVASSAPRPNASCSFRSWRSGAAAGVRQTVLRGVRDGHGLKLAIIRAFGCRGAIHGASRDKITTLQ